MIKSNHSLMYKIGTTIYFGSITIDFVTAGRKVTFVINNQAFVKELPLVDKIKI